MRQLGNIAHKQQEHIGNVTLPNHKRAGPGCQQPCMVTNIAALVMPSTLMQYTTNYLVQECKPKP
jgi:hypothetical protein